MSEPKSIYETGEQYRERVAREAAEAPASESVNTGNDGPAPNNPTQSEPPAPEPTAE